MPNGIESGSDLFAFGEAVGNYSDLVTPTEAPSVKPAPIAETPPVEQPQPTTPEPPETPEEEGLPAGTAVVPIIGMRMSVAEVDLGFARLVRSGSLEEGPEEVAGSEDNVFAVIECGPSSQAPRAASERLRQTVTSLRLLKAGGVGLGPHGWLRKPDGWSRFMTGVARARAGGYELSTEDAAKLRRISEQIAERGNRTKVFAGALARFDLAAVRTNQAEALSDYVLALRGLLDGGGPARAGVSARAAGLCAGAEGREELRAEIERALAIEQRLISGERVGPGVTPEAIATVEEVLRTLLCGMATGELGSDLRITADEILVADGLRVGEGSESALGGTAEWQIPEPDGELSVTRASSDPGVPEEPDATPDPAPDLLAPGGGLDPAGVEGTPMDNSRRELPEPPDWLSDTLGGDRDRDLVWPAFAGPHPSGKRRRRPAKERVQHLFPVPDEGDWSVAEYGRKR